MSGTSISHLFTLGDVVLYTEGVPVKSLAAWSEHASQVLHMIVQQLRLCVNYLLLISREKIGKKNNS